MSDQKQFKPVQRTPDEVAKAHMMLINFLMNNNYPFVETDGGFMVGISSIAYVPKSALEVPQKGIIT